MVKAKTAFTRFVVLALVGMELGLGAALLLGSGRTTPSQTDAPSVTISDLALANGA
jgi:hypothetical protein